MYKILNESSVKSVWMENNVFLGVDLGLSSEI